MRALVLSGGGEKGAYQAGVSRVLINQLGRRYDLFCGVSVGAINAVKLAECHDGEALAEVWLQISNRSVWRSWIFGWVSGLFRGGLRDSTPLAELLSTSVNVDRLRSSPWELSIGAVNLSTGEYEILTKHHPDILSAVLGSAANPVVLPPVRFGGSWWTDGGVRTVTPLRAAIRAGADEVDVVVCSTGRGIGAWGVDRPNLIERSLREIKILVDEATFDDLRWTDQINEMIANGLCPGKRHVEVRVIRPSDPLNSVPMEFDPLVIREMLERGEADARIAFE